MEPQQLTTPIDPLANYQQPDPRLNSFTLPDGTVYTATETLWPKRYKVFQKRQMEFGFNNTFSSFCKALDDIWADFNEKQRSASGIQKLGNLRDATSYLGSNRIAAMELTALFFNGPGENYLYYDHQAMLAKLEKWETSGVSVDFFFLQAARLVPGFYERFMMSSLSPLEASSDSEAPKSEMQP